MTDAGAALWHWRPARAPGVLRVGWPLRAVAAGGRLHIVALRPDGSGLAHAEVDERGALAALPDLPLRSTSGLAATADGLVVAGARRGDDAPALCLVPADGGPGAVVELPRPRPVAAWPVPVAVDGAVEVTWATGDGSAATVWIGALVGREVTAAPAFTAGGVLTLSATAWQGAMDVLCRCPSPRFVRWRGGRVELDRELERSAASAAALVPGAVLSRGAGHAFRVWEPDADMARELALPPPPERGSARPREPRLVAAGGRPDLLAWVTEVADDAGEEGTAVHLLASRSWLAPLDRAAWTVGAAVELPGYGAPSAVEWVGDQVAVLHVASGVVDVVLGRPVAP